jgi:DNA-directed RNA polymerase subunit F
MFVNNKTAEWLNSKTEQEREALILSVSKQVRELKTTFKNRSHEIKEQRKKALHYFIKFSRFY